MKTKLFLWVLFMAYVFCQTGNAAPVQWSGNGHWYELVSAWSTWTNARTTAQNSSYLGMPGYLVTLTTLEEDLWIRATLGVNGYWIGAYQPDGSPEPTGGYCWVTDEAWTWNDRNKADNWGNQSVLYYYPLGGAYWDDDTPTSSRSAYVIEYGTYIDDGINGNDPIMLVPEPLTLITLLAGSAAIAIRSRKK